ncbi:RNA-binding family protein isoform 1 [Hibiscus syriacus]|uniref:RNA-binding family protein isoform 1 n=1 Tax=Hibiscus syriacus TaxID=106335 RepID=A0A6A2WCR8_HIBSY|nr:RNA-binding family protein isoform 1 [Hibiscus syriacus]
MENGRGVVGSRKSSERPYKGIRMRKAYDTAVFYLRGPSARLNFPDLLVGEKLGGDLSTAFIRKKAIEVGARVDALEAAHHLHPRRDHNYGLDPNYNRSYGEKMKPSGRFLQRVDLNKMPDSEDSDGEWESK